MKKSVVILLIICASPPFIFLGYFFIKGMFFEEKTSDEIFLENMKEYSFNFKTDTMFYDRRNRSILTYSKKITKQKAPIPFEWEKYFQIGDSIVKYKDSLELSIYRNDSLIRVLDYRELRN